MSTNKSALFKNLLLFSVMSILLIPSIHTGKAHGTNSNIISSADEIENIFYLPPQSSEDNLIAGEFQESNTFLPSATRKKWTIMTYMDGDNNLEEAAIDDIGEMERGGGSVDDVNVIVLIDRIDDYDTSNGDWTGAKIYDIETDTTNDIDSTQLVNMGELAMDHPTTLQNFIEYCFANFPADYYCLNIWDHGAGVFGACSDDTSGGGLLTINEIQSAIIGATTTYPEYIDIVSFDCCVMNVLELAYELRNSCDYLVASEGNIPFDGYDYETLISDITSDPDMIPEDFCEAIVDQYGGQYPTEESTCLSAINISKIDQIMTHLDDLATNLSYGLSNYNYKYLLYQARSASRAFSNGAFVDIVDLCEKINNLFINTKLNSVATALIDAVEDAVFSNWQHTSYLSTAHGLSIFYPITDYQLPENVMNNYADRTAHFTGMDLQQDNQWGEFIRLCYNIYSLVAPEYPDFISLETQTQNTITENYIDTYLISIQEEEVYELSCIIESGDADIYLSTVTSSGYSIIIGSSLVNPDDGSIELCRRFLPAAVYTIIVLGVGPSSQYSFDISAYTIPALDVKDQQNTTGGSVYGEDGHFIQDLHHYYTVDLKKDIYSIILNNSATTNYLINIYSLDWELLDSLSPAGYGNGLQLLFNSTEEMTIIIEVYAFEGAGSFELVVLSSKGLGFSMVAALLLSVTAILTISYIRSSKKLKRN